MSTSNPPGDAAPTPKMTLTELRKKAKELNVEPTVKPEQLLETVNKVGPAGSDDAEEARPEVKASVENLKPKKKRFHGAKMSKRWFPSNYSRFNFGYMVSHPTRHASSLPFDQATKDLLQLLGDLMGDRGRETNGDAAIPAGYTYFGQFIDHDITLDVTSNLNQPQNAGNIPNMRTPVLDLDSLYGRGPALDPYMYAFPPSNQPPTAIKFLLGSNKDVGRGGPGGTAGRSGMVVKKDFDLPRMHHALNPSQSSNTAVIGDPRNDENLIVSQFHMAMLKFHNAVVDMLLVAEFPGDIFVEAKKTVRHHYQWMVVHDYLHRICGKAAVDDALANVSEPLNSNFRMPAEFSVAAFRFGHSMIRNRYWLNFNFINASLAEVFQFNRNPNLPVFSNWVVDFNAFFETGIQVPLFNNARKIDSVMSNGLESLPGGSGLMAVLATRNLHRGLAFGLSSGQATATELGVTPLTEAQLLTGLPDGEEQLLKSNGGILLQKTPLWYYILRESMVIENGDRLGPLGAKIVAETFVRMLQRDPGSYLNASSFTPSLPSKVDGEFTVADMINFSGVNQP